MRGVLTSGVHGLYEGSHVLYFCFVLCTVFQQEASSKFFMMCFIAVL